MKQEPKKIHPKTKQEWREWLEVNHDKESRISVILWKKHTGKPTISHQELMDEAICFGWIDTTVKRLDEDRYIRRFAKRTNNSKWSNATLSYAKRLIKEKKMSPKGMAMYKLGLKKPTIDHNLPLNPKIPEDLKKLFKKFPKAKKNFQNFSPSSRRAVLWWVDKAKLPQTRKDRIKKIFEAAKENKKIW
jgi:uncharacterized protein YdeI (YjbR/CyaY-like superfamily)